MSHRFNNRALLALAMFCACGVPQGDIARVANAQEPRTLEAILSAWRARETVTRSVRMEFTLKLMLPKDSRLAGPPDDMVVKQSHVLTIAGDKLRYERQGETWNDSRLVVTGMHTIRTFNGRVLNVFSNPPMRDNDLHPMGWVMKKPTHSDARNIYLSPVFRHFRPFSRFFNPINAQRLRVKKDTDLVDGDPCIVLEEVDEQYGTVHAFWVSPNKGMAILRYTNTSSDGILDLQCDCAFAKRGDQWLPDSWQAIRFSQGDKALDSGIAQMTGVTINGPVPASEFVLSFPPGTEVFDRIADASYVIHEDGTRRDILQFERDKGATYQDFLRTPAGKGASPEAATTRGSVTLWILVLSTLGLTLFIIVMRRSALWRR